ncbi:protein phosphatase 2C domain-containing protein [Streptomyces sp. MS06]|uniref:protein phosphatase 2C domain-containing protein n=1 Tax=Streptomyces sp. MS06 TaxID=3385974 RepID=UPI0039A1BA25
MNQQGGRPAGREDDWWAQLYDETTEDAGPAPAPDSLDDRFASAAGTLAERPGTDGSPSEDRVPRDAVPQQRRPTPRSGERARGGTGEGRAAAPSESPADGTSGPGGFGPGTSGPGGSDSDRAVLPRAPWEPPPAAEEPTAQSSRPVSAGSSAAVPRAEDREPDGPADLREPPAVDPRAPAAAPAASGTSPAASGTRAAPRSGDPAGMPAGAVDRTGSRGDPAAPPPAPVPHLGSGPPTYDAEPTALPQADPDALDALVADTVLDGARYGAGTLRAVSVRGDSARYRGEPRRDSLLTARFGTGDQALLLVAMATGARATSGAHLAAAEACRWIGRAVGRSHARLVEDIREARRGELKSGLHRLTDRSLGRLRAGAAEQGLEPQEYSASLRCLLLPADPECRVRVFFGVGPGGLFRLRDGGWQDIEPAVGEVAGEPVVGYGSPPAATAGGDRLTMDLGIPAPPRPYEPAPEPAREPFRFRASVARPGDVLLMCTEGLAEPLRGERELPGYLAGRWREPAPPGLAAFLADAQVRVKGYADDRTAAAVWEA